MIYTCTVNTPLGPMTAAAENDALTGLWFIGQKYYPANVHGWTAEPDLPIFGILRQRLQDYFREADSNESITRIVRRKALDPREQPLLRLAPQGTVFQKAVWEELQNIPFGKITTYGNITKSIAKTHGFSAKAAQAVGGAVGHNPISIFIPCHRVVGANHQLTGYAGGLDKKATLLRIEGADMEQMALVL